MTEEEFVDWASKVEFGNYEWVEGKVEVMSLVSIMHGRLMLWFINLLALYAEQGRRGEAFPDNVQVRLPTLRRRNPDVKFVADDGTAQIMEKHILGVPDLCIEIISEDNPARDYVTKFAEYADAEVPEYWIADPISGDKFFAWTLQDGRYVPIPEVDGKVASVALPGLVIDVAWLHQRPLPDPAECLKKMPVVGGKKAKKRGKKSD